MVDLTVNGRQITRRQYSYSPASPNRPSQCISVGDGSAPDIGTERGFNAYASTHVIGFVDGRRRRRSVSAARNTCWFRRAITTIPKAATWSAHTTADDYAKYPRPHSAARPRFQSPMKRLYPPYADIDNAWGMSIDLSRCIGCNACIIACQAENNIPVVGKERSRRAAARCTGFASTPISRARGKSRGCISSPCPAMHCETAPCEYGLPGRSDDAQLGRHQRNDLQPLHRHALLLEQLPLQGAAFQLLSNTPRWDVPSLKLMHNPDVTVRSRGVMEKCTYCVQRINRRRIEA